MEEEANTTMLPYVLDVLSRQPDLAMSIYDLENTLKKHFKSFRRIKKQIKFAINVGRNMGLLSLSGDRVCVTFSYRCPTAIKESTSQLIEKNASKIGKLLNLKLKKRSDHNRYTASDPDVNKYKASSGQRFGHAKKQVKKNNGSKERQCDD